MILAFYFYNRYMHLIFVINKFNSYKIDDYKNNIKHSFSAVEIKPQNFTKKIAMRKIWIN